MNRQIKKVARLIVLCCFTLVVLTACEDGDKEIFDSIEPQIERETDEVDEKKSKPGS